MPAALCNACPLGFENIMTSLLSKCTGCYNSKWYTLKSKMTNKKWSQNFKKVVAHLRCLDIWVLSINFQKSFIGWPPQPPTEKIPKFNLICIWNIIFMILPFYFFFSKHKNEIVFVIRLLNSRIWLILKTSMIFLALDTSVASMILAASKTHKPFFLKKLPDPDDFIPPWDQNAIEGQI